VVAPAGTPAAAMAAIATVVAACTCADSACAASLDASALAYCAKVLSLSCWANSRAS
jgi:hypothetical protein